MQASAFWEEILHCDLRWGWLNDRGQSKKKKPWIPFEPYKWKGNTQYVDIKKKIVEILSQFKNGHWTKLLARHFLDIREMIYKQLLFVWHRSVLRTMDINLSQAFPSLVQYKSLNPKIQQAAHISDRVQKKRCTIPTYHCMLQSAYKLCCTL